MDTKMDTNLQKKKKLKRNILLIIFGLILGFFAGMSYFIGEQVFLSSTQLVTNEDTTGVGENFWNTYGMDYENFCDTYTIEELIIDSTFEEHQIPADYIYATDSNESKDNKTVILVHGLGGNRYSNYPLAEMFLELGFNVLSYDQRSSNKNTAKYTTFGYFEKYDLMDCIDYVTAEAPEQMIGVWGTSFGGATSGLAMGENRVKGKVDFLVLDCPVSSMKWMIDAEMKQMNIGIPVSYMSLCGNMINRIKLGFSYKDADVSTAIQDIEIPVLIINSKADTLTPQFMGQDIYDSIKSSKKTIWTSEDSTHANIFLDYKEEYREKIEDLIQSVSQ